MSLWIGPDASRPLSAASHQLPPGPDPQSGNFDHQSPAQPLKVDRLVVGVLAGTAMFYLLGKALGLGRR